MANALGGKRQPKFYANYLLQSEYRMLNDWCILVDRMFGFEGDKGLAGLYLVGSVLRKTSYRDVDIRLIMADDTYAAHYDDNRRKYTNLAVSLWGQKATGLPIDFQIQPMSLANTRYSGANRRHAIGHPHFDRVDNLDPPPAAKE
jgi:hypothetical protein